MMSDVQRKSVRRGELPPSAVLSVPGRMRLRRKRQGGNAFIEFACCYLVFFAMLFMTMDVCVVIFLKQVFANAVREGVRWAITFSTTYNGSSCSSGENACIKQVVADNSLGFISANSSYLSVTYYAPYDLSHPWTANSNPPAPYVAQVYPNQTNNVIEVSITNFPWNWMVPLPGIYPGRSLTLSASASDVLEGLPAGSTVPPTP